MPYIREIAVSLNIRAEAVEAIGVTAGPSCGNLVVFELWTQSPTYEVQSLQQRMFSLPQEGTF